MLFELTEKLSWLWRWDLDPTMFCLKMSSKAPTFS